MRKRHVAIQERDLQILRGLLDSRIMTHAHAAKLYFAGSIHAAKKRLQKLKSAGLLSERTRRMFDRAVLHLSKDGLRLLAERGILSEYPSLSLSEHTKRARVSDITIRHEVEVMDVKASICAACANLTGTLIEVFTTWPQLLQFECAPFGAPLTVKPDGFFRIRETTREQRPPRAYYLELDRSTETLATLLLRANSYVAHFKSGGFAKARGAWRSEFRDYPFRALFVVKSAERLNNMAEALILNNPPILTHVWLTTFDEVVREPLGAIWMRPLEYREALVATVHSPLNRRGRGVRRSRFRDELVAKHAKKRRLLD